MENNFEELTRNREMFKDILKWFVENDTTGFTYINNVLTSEKLHNIKLWFWCGKIKYSENNQTKASNMSNIISFEKGVIRTNNNQTLKLN